MRPSGVMPMTLGNSAKSLLGSSTTSAGPPAFRAWKILSRAPPPTVTCVPVSRVNSAASARAPGAAEAVVSTVIVAAPAGLAINASTSNAAPNGLMSDGGGIHMQDIDQIFEIALDVLFHGAARRDHRGVKVQRHPALVVPRDQELLDGGGVHAGRIRPT